MLVVLLLLLGAACSQSTVEQTVLCGRELAKAHSMYCYGIDPFPAVAAKSNVPLLLTSERSIPERFTYRAPRTSEERLSAANLVAACCMKPCHISELLNHC